MDSELGRSPWRKETGYAWCWEAQARQCWRLADLPQMTVGRNNEGNTTI